LKVIQQAIQHYDMATTTTELAQAPVTFSERAVEAVKEVRQQEQVPDHQFLRVGVTGGGCSGLSYVLEFDDKGEYDKVFEIGGVQMVMDKRHEMYLYNCQIDFDDGLNARGFTFTNPNATDTCGCGTSFSA
jgi:iron-sulfur cluster assembly protein